MSEIKVCCRAVLPLPHLPPPNPGRLCGRVLPTSLSSWWSRRPWLWPPHSCPCSGLTWPLLSSPRLSSVCLLQGHSSLDIGPTLIQDGLKILNDICEDPFSRAWTCFLGATFQATTLGKQLSQASASLSVKRG